MDKWIDGWIDGPHSMLNVGAGESACENSQIFHAIPIQNSFLAEPSPPPTVLNKYTQALRKTFPKLFQASQIRYMRISKFRI